MIYYYCISYKWYYGLASIDLFTLKHAYRYRAFQSFEMYENYLPFLF